MKVVFCFLLIIIQLTVSTPSYSESLKSGSYDGYFSNHSFPDMSMKGKLVFVNDTSGYMTIYNRRGHYDGSIKITDITDDHLKFSIFDKDGDEICFDLILDDDSLYGRWSYQDLNLGYCGDALFMYEGPYIPTPQELYSIDNFLPDDFQIPQVLETEQFRLRMLTVEDAEKDYDAVMSSAEYLREMTGGLWPSDSLSLEDNIEDLTRHQQDFLDGEAFTYTVVSLDEDSVLGCVYINPPSRKDLEADAVVFMWVRYSEYLNGLDSILYQTVSTWLEQEWLFEKVIYPGRE